MRQHLLLFIMVACTCMAQAAPRFVTFTPQSDAIALKEADETEYWLDLLHETKYLDDTMYNSINDDCGELIRILTTIIRKIKDNPQGK